jgi:hypothetical protein
MMFPAILQSFKNTVKKSIASLLVLLVLAIHVVVPSVQLAQAKCQPMKKPLIQRRLTGPLLLKFLTPVSSITSQQGDSFKAIVDTTSCFKFSCVTKGTMLLGYVRKVERSRKFHRPAYVDIQLTQLQFPDGTAKIYRKPYHKARIKLTAPDAYGVGRQLRDEVPSVLGATAVVVPLALATTLSAGAIIPLGFAGAIIASAVQEAIQARRGLSSGGLGRKTARVVARGTLFPYVAYKATKRTSEVYVKPNQVVAIKPGRRFANDLYQR